MTNAVLRLAAIVSLLTVVEVAPGTAHAPFFGQTEQIILPDGRVGEMRLLYGDGIIISNPARVIVLDSDNRLIGYSNETFSEHTIFCSADRRCVGYRHDDNTVLEFIAKESFIGPVVTDGLSTDLWRKRDDRVNMDMRPPRPSEFGFANYRLMTLNLSVSLVILGMLMGAPLLMLWYWVIGRRLGIASKVVIWVAAVVVEFILLFWSFLAAAFIGGISLLSWFLSLSIGVMFTFALAWLSRSPKRAPAG